jgi:hypothetical protein
MNEPSVEEIVARLEQHIALDDRVSMVAIKDDLRALIADWRKRGEVAEAMMDSRNYWREEWRKRGEALETIAAGGVGGDAALARSGIKGNGEGK